MIISGPAFSIADLHYALLHRVELKRIYFGLRVVPHACSCRSTFTNISGCDVTLDYGGRTCAFDSSKATLFTFDFEITDIDGNIIHNDTCQYLLAKYGDAYVDCWSVGTETLIEVSANAWAIFDVTECTTVVPFHEFKNDARKLRSMMIDGDEINCLWTREGSVPFGCFSHSPSFIGKDRVIGRETVRIRG